MKYRSYEPVRGTVEVVDGLPSLDTLLLAYEVAPGWAANLDIPPTVHLSPLSIPGSLVETCATFS